MLVMGDILRIIALKKISSKLTLRGTPSQNTTRASVCPPVQLKVSVMHRARSINGMASSVAAILAL